MKVIDHVTVAMLCTHIIILHILHVYRAAAVTVRSTLPVYQKELINAY